jgi:hypothetical protein
MTTDNRGLQRVRFLDGLFDDGAQFVRERKSNIGPAQFALSDFQPQILHDRSGARAHLAGDLTGREALTKQLGGLILSQHVPWMRKYGLMLQGCDSSDGTNVYFCRST